MHINSFIKAIILTINVYLLDRIITGIFTPIG